MGYEKQVVNGYNHRLTYVDEKGNKRTVVVYESIEGDLKITSDGTSQEEM